MALRRTTQFTLRISGDRAHGFQAAGYLSGAPLTAPAPITGNELHRLEEVINHYRRHLVTPSAARPAAAPELAAAATLAAGVELFHLWLAPHWGALQAARVPGVATTITLAATAPVVLNLPWELALPPESILPLGLDPAYAVRRLPQTASDQPHCCPPTLHGGPLRVLLAAAPLPDHPELATTLARLAERLHSPGELACSWLPPATFDEVATVVTRLQPHLLVLAGGTLIRNQRGFFGFRDDGEETIDLRSGWELANQLLINSGVSCLAVVGVGSPAPPLAATHGVCQEVVANRGVHLALAWPLTVPPDPGSGGLELLLRELSTTSHAVDHALCAVRNRLAQLDPGPPWWSLPALYASSTLETLINPNAPRILADFGGCQGR